MNYFIIIDAITLILGIYIIFVSLRMKKSGKIESTFVAEDEMKKIKDTAGYIAYIYPKSLVFGIVIFVISIVAIVSDCLKKIPYWSYVEMIILSGFQICYEMPEKNLLNSNMNFALQHET